MYTDNLTSQSSINGGTIEIAYIPATQSDLIMGDLPDNYGVRPTDSHYVATLVIDSKVVATATGLTRNTAIANCYTNYATACALRDLELMEGE